MEFAECWTIVCLSVYGVCRVWVCGWVFRMQKILWLCQTLILFLSIVSLHIDDANNVYRWCYTIETPLPVVVEVVYAKGFMIMRAILYAASFHCSTAKTESVVVADGRNRMRGQLSVAASVVLCIESHSWVANTFPITCDFTWSNRVALARCVPRSILNNKLIFMSI